jgi:hypothetical protein
MRCAEDWDNGKGIDENGDKLTVSQFANLCGIKPNTFQKYAHVDRTKRRALGSHKLEPSPSSVWMSNNYLLRD